MGNVATALDKYVRDVIALPRKQISLAARSRDWFLDRIQSEIEKRDEEPVLYAEEPFLGFGSYFKGTKVATVDEFDVLVVIDSCSGVFTHLGNKVGNGLGRVNPNPKYLPKYLKSDGSGVSPAKLLNWLKGIVEAVVEPFDGEAPIRDGQAITAIIKSHDLKIDLVPAGIFKRVTDDVVFYDIPKGNRDNDWILTSPKLDMQRLEDVAKDKANFRNVVRIAKRIKDRYAFTVSSFAIETVLVDYGNVYPWYDNFYLDLKGALTNLAAAFRIGTVGDPFDPSDNLIADVESLSWYAKRIDGIVDGLQECSGWSDQQKVFEKVRGLLENE